MSTKQLSLTLVAAVILLSGCNNVQVFPASVDRAIALCEPHNDIELLKVESFSGPLVFFSEKRKHQNKIEVMCSDGTYITETFTPKQHER